MGNWNLDIAPSWGFLTSKMVLKSQGLPWDQCVGVGAHLVLVWFDLRGQVLLVTDLFPGLGFQGPVLCFAPVFPLLHGVLSGGCPLWAIVSSFWGLSRCCPCFPDTSCLRTHRSCTFSHCSSSADSVFSLNVVARGLGKTVHHYLPSLL